MPTILLPRPQKDEQAWPAQPPGFFPLTVEDIRKRLAQSEYMAPDAIASPLAQLHFVNWALEDLSAEPGTGAAAMGDVLLLLQFLGHLDPVEHMLKDLGDLGNMLRDHWGTEAILCWRLKELPDSGCDGEFVAISHPNNPILPSAKFYPYESANGQSWGQVQRSLVKRWGPSSSARLLDEKCKVADGDLAGSLSTYLKRWIAAAGSPEPSWVGYLRHWAGHLDSLVDGRQPLPVADLSVKLMLNSGKAVSFGTYAGREGREVWTCAKCDPPQAWLNIGESQTVSATCPEVRCPTHNQSLRGGSDPVGPTHYGAHLVGETLFVWVDGPLPPGATDKKVDGEHGKDGSITYSFNQQTVTVRGRLVSSEKSVLRRIAWMSGLTGRGAADQVPVEIPVSGEFAELVDESCEADDRTRQWRLRLRGFSEACNRPYPEFEETLWARSAIVVWPPEDCTGWSIDYVACSTPLMNRARFRVIEESAGGKLHGSPVLHTNALYRTAKGKARFIEVGEVDGNSFRSLGLVPVRRTEASSAVVGAPGRIVLDFGTTSSAVLWHIQGDPEPSFIKSGPDSLETVCFLARDDEEFQNLLKGVDILAAWNVGETPPRPYLPSLYAKPDPDKPNSGPSIPPRGKGLDLLAKPGGGEGRIVSGLKWREWGAHSNGDYLRALLELLLVPACWELRKRGCSTATLSATYPLAFGNQKKDKYKETLEEVIKGLKPSTGLEIAPITLTSESHAGSSYLPQGNFTHSVVLDVGGGTTDIVIDHGPASPLSGSSAGREVLVADSIEYAGRDFLRVIVFTFGLDACYKKLAAVERTLSPPRRQPSDSEFPEAFVEAYVASLEALLHKSNVKGLYDFLHVSPDGDPVTNKLRVRDVLVRWEALLAGLMLYTRRMLEGAIAEGAEDQPVTIAFNLFGQGWELLRLLGDNPNTSIQQVMEPRLRELCNMVAHNRGGDDLFPAVQVVPPHDDPKTVVVRGAFGLADGKKFPPLGGQIPAPGHAIAADVRWTFLGMDLYRDENLVKPARTRLRDHQQRPDWPGDIGYRKVLSDLLDAVPDKVGGVPMRKMVRDLLPKRQPGGADVLEHLIRLGESDFNTRTWPKGENAARQSLLGGFLTSVWKSIWAGPRP